MSVRTRRDWTPAGFKSQCFPAIAAVLVYALTAVVLGSSPGWAQRKGAAAMEFAPAAASAKMAGDAKVYRVIGARNGSSKLFSATTAGLQMSEDAGRFWQKLPIRGRDERIFALEIHPTIAGKLYVGRSDGLWLSTDSGRSWDALTAPGSVPVALAVSPSEPDTLYLATSRQGVHKSKDGGRTWQQISTGLPVSHSGNSVEQVSQLWVDPGNANKVLASIERLGVFRTVDGKVWDEFNNGLPFPFPRPVSGAKLAYDSSQISNHVYLAMEHPLHSHLMRARLFVLDEQEAWRPLRVRLPDNFPVRSLVVDAARQKLQLWGDQTVLEAPLPR